jgi:hypothetical protein
MDTEIDFLRADLLYLVLIADRSLVIEPFTLSAKLIPFRKIIEVFYSFAEFDPQILNDVEYAGLMFDGVEENNLQSDSKSLAFIAGATDELLKIAVNYSNVKSIILKKSLSDPAKYPTLVIYNKKTGNLANAAPFTSKDEQIAWCQYVIDMVKESSLEDTITYLNKISNAIRDLYVWTIDGSKEQYIKLIQGFSALEQSIIARICEVKYCIDLSSLKNMEVSADSSEQPISPYNDTYEESGISDSINAESNNNEELFQLASEMGDEEPPNEPPNEPFVEAEAKTYIEHQNESMNPINENGNTDYFLEYQKFQTNSPEYVPVFEIMLNEIKTQSNANTQTPEGTYVYLRQKDWHTGIPHSFFWGMFRLYMIDLVHKIKPANFPEVVRKEAQKLKDACEVFSGFPASFLTPELIESLEKDAEIEPFLAHHNALTLPVIPSKKNIKPMNSTISKEHKESIPPSKKIIRIQNPSSANFSPNLSVNISNVTKTHPIINPGIRQELFDAKFDSTLKKLTNMSKKSQIAFFSAKLEKFKKQLLQ